MTHSADLSATGTKPALRRKRFTLSGRSIKLDPLDNAVRGDLADVTLADQVFAPHYAEAHCYRAIARVSVRRQATANAEIATTLAVGDTFHVLDISGGWAWGRADVAASVGYVPHEAIAPA